MNNTSVKHIVCIEDEPEMIELIRLILGRRGFDVHGAPGGKEGLKMVRELLPDLVLLDLMMPEMDGFTVIEALRAKQETATIPVIVATAKELTPDEKNRLSGQIQSLMQKGDFLNDEFLEEVKTLIK